MLLDQCIDVDLLQIQPELSSFMKYTAGVWMLISLDTVVKQEKYEESLLKLNYQRKQRKMAYQLTPTECRHN